MPSHSPLEQLRSLDQSSPDFQDQISNILVGKKFRDWVPTIQDDSLVGLVDYLDKVRRCFSLAFFSLILPQTLDTLDPASSAFRRCLRELRHVCGNRTILPPSYTLSSRILGIGPHPVAAGGSGDVYEGTLNDSRVCIKRVRIYSKEGPKKATKVRYRHHHFPTRSS